MKEKLFDSLRLLLPAPLAIIGIFTGLRIYEYFAAGPRLQASADTVLMPTAYDLTPITNWPTTYTES